MKRQVILVTTMLLLSSMVIGGQAGVNISEHRLVAKVKNLLNQCIKITKSAGEKITAPTQPALAEKVLKSASSAIKTPAKKLYGILSALDEPVLKSVQSTLEKQFKDYFNELMELDMTIYEIYKNNMFSDAGKALDQANTEFKRLAKGQ
ncbi:MAG: hypothetical protein HPY53_03415 [Brevinematales bacterium]|nr:hypothetical protein [Brevinematales bacterium]